MIAKLNGKLDSVGTDSVIVDVGGVGYLVFCSAMTMRGLPAQGAMVTLVIETHVREDHIHLYGFAHDSERRWFKALQDVQGVGAKVALSLLSAATPSVLAQAIAAQDDAPLRSAQGVGPKLAKRILIEMKDRAPGIALDATRPTPSEAIAATPAVAEDATMSDAVSALVNLGYGRSDAFAAVATSARAKDGKATVADLIRGGLSELGREATR
ncbi:MAG: Holliday junction branch migration protein RuvA [Alphaproteobacteria bacterium]|nr:Holliday junction branch migration protein RuvA [Alphaproteobacteria bacterium]